MMSMSSSKFRTTINDVQFTAEQEHEFRILNRPYNNDQVDFYCIHCLKIVHINDYTKTKNENS